MSSSAILHAIPRNSTIAFTNNQHRHRQCVRYYHFNRIFFLCESNKPRKPLLLLLLTDFSFTRLRSSASIPGGDGAAVSSSSSAKNNVEHDDKQDEEEAESIVQAREVVSQILQEFGVSGEESTEIASKSPKYVKMLTDSVRELDELALWDSWSSNTETNKEGVTFKMKVYEMAKQKGDKGVLPLLESLGLSLSSATHVARYLSSETLPTLIRRVKYVKEVFFSDSDDLSIIGKKAHRMMVHLSIPADEDLQQTLSFFEKIQARRGGLDLLGSKGSSLRYLLESFPRLLMVPVESHMQPIVEFLEDVGVPKKCMNHILLLFPPIMFYNLKKEIIPRLQPFEKVSSEYKDVGRMLLKYPWILSLSIQRNYQDVLGLFYTEKVPNASIDRATRSWPHFFGCSVSKLKVMVELFSELGIRQKKLGHVIATSPQLLLRKPQEFLQVVSFLKGLGLEEEDIGRTLGRCPEVFASNTEKTLKRKTGFLSSIGVSKTHFPRVIRKYPEFFVCDVDKALHPRMKYFLKIGLSRKDVGFMVRRFSPLLGYSIEEVLRPKLEFLVNTMGKPLKEVVDYPRYFSYSLEKKIKPRYWILKGRNIECSLKEMLGKNDEEFAAEFMGVGRMLVPPPSLE